MSLIDSLLEYKAFSFKLFIFLNQLHINVDAFYVVEITVYSFCRKTSHCRRSQKHATVSDTILFCQSVFYISKTHPNRMELYNHVVN
jgi:hypothetical protein